MSEPAADAGRWMTRRRYWILVAGAFTTVVGFVFAFVYDWPQDEVRAPVQLWRFAPWVSFGVGLVGLAVVVWILRPQSR